MALGVLRLLVLCAVVGLGAAALIRRAGEETQCIGGVAYRVTYETFGFGDESFVDLDNVTGLTGMQCDIDNRRMLLSFTSSSDAQAFSQQLGEIEPFQTFVTSLSSDFTDCSAEKVLVRRFIGVNSTTDPSQLVIFADPAKYDEIFQDADVSIASAGSCGDVTEHVCVGVNVDSSCQDAKQPIPIYQNSYLSVSCSDCFLGFSADVFLSLTIHFWKLEGVAAGFKNLQLGGGLLFDMAASAAWSTGVDKNVDLVPQTTILDFKIGIVPVRIWFEVPVEIKADATFHASAEATAGAMAQWTLEIGRAHV